MIEDYWNLQFDPFQNQLSKHWYYESPMHDETLARLYYVIEKRQRCGVFLGLEGTGKSLLMQLLKRQASRTQRQVALVDVYGMEDREILWNLIGELGLGSHSHSDTAVLWRILTDHLTGCSISFQQLVFLFDHLVHATERGQQCVERIMHLAMSQGGWVTSIFSCRSDELGIIPSGIYEQADLKIKLDPLDAFHTAEYINTALRQAGADRTIFPTSTMHHLFEMSGGIPRRINQICHLALLAGVNARAEQISPDLLNAAQELAIPPAESAGPSLETQTPAAKSVTRSGAKNKKK
ncbi:MAG TPA: AAA family ATPase [Planctomycetaceae bacterium]|nr:AAA family ATPase [Planctomycetaceae bacterium]